MSSLDSQFLCLGTIFNNDIVRHYKGKDRYTDKQQVLFTRLFIIAIVAVTYLLALALGANKSVFALGVWCFSGFSALFPIIIGALYWRKLTAAGAIAGVLAAISSWCGLFYLAYSQNNVGKYLLEIPFGGETYPVMPVVAMFFSSLIVMVVVSLVTPKPRPETIAKFFND